MVWRYSGGTLQLDRTLVMGILNVTPDSFSDGGQFAEPEKAVAHAAEMERDGAAMIDLGGQSTRPGSRPISWQEEWERIHPVLLRLRETVGVPISVDTFYPEVAQRALENGAAVINDVSGSLQNGMPELAACYGAGLVMMHAGNGADDTGEEDAVAAVRRYFETALETAQKAGLPRENVCLDVGIGFGKSRRGDREVVARLAEIRKGLPPVAVLCGASRKRVTAGEEPLLPVTQRLPGTLAIHTLAQWNGARILRVHDVKEAVTAARLVDAVREERG